ncbi:NAD-dependent epimerase/dehydratase family protein [Verrucomicrobiales bacterium]|nr:NAD-dependent epimerase/dehydratase family protein [Verrucomicrobiales bacterium]
MVRAPQSIEELDEIASKPSEAVIEALSGIEGPIVVAGAGGKMGFHLCRMLRRGFDHLNMSNEIVGISRFGDAATRSLFDKQGITTLSADLTNPVSYNDLPEASAVFFLAGRKFGTSDSPETLRLFNEEMPSMVAERYADSDIVALSTGCVYSFVTPESGGSVETDPTDPVGDYAQSCLGRERAFIHASEKHGTALSLIRLNYSVDLRYGVLVDLASKVFAGEEVDVTMGYLNCIWQGDATEHIIQALAETRPAPTPFILNVTGSRLLKIRELALWFSRRFDRRVTLTGLEAETAWLNNAEKSHRLFGAPGIAEDALMEWVAQWIENDRPLLGKPTHFEVRDGKY